MADVVSVSIRESRGSRNARRLRNSGQLPAVLYGHGKESVSLSVPADQLSAAIRHGVKMVELQGGVSENALIRDVQWDPFGVDVLHIDFARVDLSEEVETTVRVEIRGEAPGTRVGGVVEQQIREIEILCPVSNIPDHLELNINSLELGQVLHVSDLVLPEGAKLVTEPTAPAVQCVEPTVELEDEEVSPTDGAEPEIVGRKAEPEEETT